VSQLGAKLQGSFAPCAWLGRAVSYGAAAESGHPDAFRRGSRIKGEADVPAIAALATQSIVIASKRISINLRRRLRSVHTMATTQI
jgi:hypothetical protein